MIFAALHVFAIFAVTSSSFIRDPVSFRSHVPLTASEKEYKWSEEWLDDVPIDHFSFLDNRTFHLRFLINTDYYSPHGPIFFYTGNEGSIEGFALNTGFMWDLAPQMHAAVVFAEHRFYGKTQPFGNESYTSLKNLGYLSSEQALADFAMLVQFLKNERLEAARDAAVIAFGGSYGGMLSAWMRVKYPHLIDGAIAASAPVFWFMDTPVREDSFDFIVTRSFTNSGCNFEAVHGAWAALDHLAANDTGRLFLNKLFHLEEKSYLSKPEDVLFLKEFIRESFESMAMVNYPYPSNFLAPLPGWPVRAACGYFNSSSPRTDEKHAEALFGVVNLFYNYTGAKASLCANPQVCDESAYGALGDPLGWPWQACTEMVMQLCGGGPPNDFFWKDCPFSAEGAARTCEKIFSSIGYCRQFLRPHWVIRNYGDRFPTATNIVFSNGYLDPWSAGGWSLKTETVGSLISIIITDGAHHYDLRGAHPDDTEAVKEARARERIHIKKWIKRANVRSRKAQKYVYSPQKWLLRKQNTVSKRRQLQNRKNLS